MQPLYIRVSGWLPVSKFGRSETLLCTVQGNANLVWLCWLIGEIEMDRGAGLAATSSQNKILKRYAVPQWGKT